MGNDGQPAPAEGTIRFGEINPHDTSAMVAAGVQAGNIVRSAPGGSGPPVEVLDLPETSRAHRERDMAKIQELELRRTMKNLVVPVIDAEVRALLRRLREPVTLFGEREMERRERLKKLLATMGDEKAQELAEAQQLPESMVPVQVPNELFYTEGPDELKAARIDIAHWSLPRAAQRIAEQKQRAAAAAAVEADSEAREEAEQARIFRALHNITNSISEVADERPVVGCRFSPDGALLATGSWSGGVKVWSMPDCRQNLAFRAHGDRVTGVAWHPSASAASAPHALMLATASADKTARLWSASGRLLRTFEGHTDRLGRLAFHGMGRRMATASFDTTWRLWDIETGHCLLEQEGHSRAVYSVAFQCDGSLAASAGMDGYGRVWDVRTGRCVLTLEGHVKGVLAVDFSPNGYQLATGSEDHSARVWDLRRRGVLAVLPGHNSLVSDVRFSPNAEGSFLMTCGYDGANKLWGGPRYRLAKTLAGHEGKVMGGDAWWRGDAKDGVVLASVGYDRTLKLWQPDPLAAGAHDDGGMVE